MSHLCCIFTYPGGNATLARHFPYYQNCGSFDRIVAITTTDKPCAVPQGCEQEAIGTDGYIRGDHLIKRLMDTIAWALSQPYWDVLTLSEYDVVFFRPLPDLPQGFCGLFAGPTPPGCTAEFFWHWPFVADRSTWGAVLWACLTNYERRVWEVGSPDVFISKAVIDHQIPAHVFMWPGYTKNTIHADWHIREARECYRNGMVSCHGIKDGYGASGAEVLEAIVAP